MQTRTLASVADSNFDWRRLISYWGVIVGLLCLYIPSYIDVAKELWPDDENAHGPLVLLIFFGLLFLKRKKLAALVPVPQKLWGWLFLIFGLLCYVVGRSQDIYILDLGSQIPVLLGLSLIFGGWRAVRVIWFAIFFLIFLIPLPGPLVTALTGSLKAQVSAWAETVLYHAGYPIARSGVILQVGSYQLMVANACSGLYSIFSLSSVGFLYIYLMRYQNFWRNLILVSSILPLAFSANVVRVLTLILVTYHFGDEMGQGVVHGLTGMGLFALALMLIFMLDAVLSLFFKEKK